MICFRIACLLLSTSFQAAPPPDPARQLDFWVGEWELTGKQRTAPDKDEWQETRATNSIRAILKGNVIEENFETEGFQGKSVSAYDRRSKQWKQTWVDDQGSYLDLTGGWSDGRMTLSRKAAVNGGTVMQRMVFHDIKADSLVWDWETSRDEGKTWKLMWQLNYRRKGKPAGQAKSALDFKRKEGQVKRRKE
jgi:hypothetical protein